MRKILATLFWFFAVLIIANAASVVAMVFVMFIFFPTTPLWPQGPKLAPRGCRPRPYAPNNLAAIVIAH